MSATWKRRRQILKKGDRDSILVGNKYKLLSNIGSGSFGQIYMGVNIKNGQEVAIKFENIITSWELPKESFVYKELHKEIGFPNVKWCGNSYMNNIMVMDLLGPSLDHLFQYCVKPFSLKTVLMLADQLILLLQHIHFKGFLHGDIKPANILMGLNNMGHVAHFVDFGLAKQYREPKSVQHIPFKTNRVFEGTPTFASLHTHQGLEQGRRDDLESLAYTLIYLLRGSLPWDERNRGTQGYEEAQENCAKQKEQPEVFCEGLPDEFKMMITYCRDMKFEYHPEYRKLRRMFYRLFVEKGYKYDYIFDWNEVANLERKIKIKSWRTISLKPPVSRKED